MGQSPLCHQSNPQCLPLVFCYEDSKKGPRRKQQHPVRLGSTGQGIGALTFRPARLKLFTPHERFRFRDSYELTRKIGEGASANVWEAIRQPLAISESSPNDQHQYTAVKIFDTDSGRQKGSFRSQMEFFEIEWALLAQLEHPHIVRMFECFIDSDSSLLYLVMELCCGGELIAHVRKETRRRGRGGLEEQDARDLFRQMLYATTYLHGHMIVHRDIKLENFLLVRSSQCVLKLCDFGTAVILTKSVPRADGRVGTLSYTAPEICSGLGAALPADAWSLGVVLYVLVVGSKPFRISKDDDKDATANRIMCGNFNELQPSWRTASEMSKELVKCLITVQESQRLSAFDALVHPWCSVDAPNLITLNRDASQVWQIINSPHGCLDPLQRFVLHLCSQLVSETELVRNDVWSPWYDLFFALDSNKDGRLDKMELEEGLRDQNDLKQKLYDLDLDLDGSGYIEWSEWAALALLSVGGLSLSDELLLNAVRLLRDESCHDGFDDGRLLRDQASEEVVEVLVEDPPELDIGSRGIPVSSHWPALSTTRLIQLQSRFGKWVQIHADALTPIEEGDRAASRANEICLDDLQEILNSISWFQPEGTTVPEAHCTPALPFASSLSLIGSPREPLFDEFHLAATPMASPREDAQEERGIPNGPQAMSSLRVIAGANLSSSAPNSPCSSASGPGLVRSF